MNNLFKGIYKGRRVLLTGHSGFKGSWMLYFLGMMGAYVTGYSLPAPTEPNHISLLDANFDSETGDIRDPDRLKAVFDRYRPEIVFHMAAQSLVRLSYSKPVETYDVNVLGTVNVLEACRNCDSVRAVVNITSDKCYENREWLWGYRENDPMGGYDPYSSSKGCAELVTASYRNSFFNPADYKKKHNLLLASVRAGNVIGGGDWAEDRLIPDIVKAASKNETVIIRSPDSIRPWQHVLEPLSGYLLLGQKLLEGDAEFAEAWNFGPGDEGTVTVLQVIEHLKASWNRIDYRIERNAGNPHEAQLLKLDCSKSNIRLKWHSVWNNRTAMTKTAEWYKDFYEKGEVLTEKQIREYVEAAGKASASWTL
jgi:CDP-glucose 4,6-dehydratase